MQFLQLTLLFGTDRPLVSNLEFPMHSYFSRPEQHTGCAKKVTPFWYLSFLPLLDALFAIFVYLHIIFIKCLI